MSGGYFNYDQFRINQIAEQLEDYIEGHPLDEDDIKEAKHDNHRGWLGDEEWKYIKENKHSLPNRYGYGEKTIKEFKKGLKILRLAYIYAQRIDYLLECDDGEDTFHERLAEDIAEMKKNQK